MCAHPLQHSVTQFKYASLSVGILCDNIAKEKNYAI